MSEQNNQLRRQNLQYAQKCQIEYKNKKLESNDASDVQKELERNVIKIEK